MTSCASERSLAGSFHLNTVSVSQVQGIVTDFAFDLDPISWFVNKYDIDTVTKQKNINFWYIELLNF